MVTKTRQQSDRSLQESVIRELEWDPRVEASRIGVSAADGSITLTGDVTTYSEKIEAIKAAERVAGVRAVADEIEVKLSRPHIRDDSEIAQAAARALRWNNLVPDGVTADIRDGYLTLHGQVDWQYQRDAAERSVRDLIGVRGVANLIEVRPRAEEREIDRRIREALERHARLDASQIRVTTSGGTARLDGQVHSLSERTVAADAAWAAPGVREVDNRLVVVP